ncbi:unnamed protein product [Dibothriocephalus latus]|uniref:Uncharacterized protein n=1 Tax=Dibothriocephalus latus TaxID=60516 RepID=A0A3P7NS13_DIBLA|nr:unnamed protein product [Dibothriocephalus latus]
MVTATPQSHRTSSSLFSTVLHPPASPPDCRKSSALPSVLVVLPGWLDIEPLTTTPTSRTLSPPIQRSRISVRLNF